MEQITFWLIGLSSATRTRSPPGGATAGGGCRLRSLGRRGACQRQFDEETASLSGFTLGPQAAAHEVNQPARNRQPEAGAAELPCVRPVGLREGVENRVEFVRRDADSGIAHLEADHVAVSRREASP